MLEIGRSAALVVRPIPNRRLSFRYKLRLQVVLGLLISLVSSTFGTKMSSLRLSHSSIQSIAIELFYAVGLPDAFEKFERELSEFDTPEREAIRAIVAAYIGARYFNYALFWNPDSSLEQETTGDGPQDTANTLAQETPANEEAYEPRVTLPSLHKMNLASLPPTAFTHYPAHAATIPSVNLSPSFDPITNIYGTSQGNQIANNKTLEPSALVTGEDNEHVRQCSTKARLEANVS